MREERWRALRQSHRALHEAKQDGSCADGFDEIGNQFGDVPPLTWSQVVSVRESRPADGFATLLKPSGISSSTTLEEVAVEATDEKQDPFSRVKAAHFKLQKAHASPEWVKQVSLFLDQQMGESDEGGVLLSDSDDVVQRFGGETVGKLRDSRLNRRRRDVSELEDGTTSSWWSYRLPLFMRRQLGRLRACVGGRQKERQRLESWEVACLTGDDAKDTRLQLAVPKKSEEEELEEQLPYINDSIAERHLVVARWCIRACIAEEVDEFLSRTIESNELADFSFGPEMPTLLVAAEIFKSCPLVRHAFLGDDRPTTALATLVSPVSCRLDALRCAVMNCLEDGAWRALATGYNFRSKLVAILSSPLVYAVASLDVAGERIAHGAKHPLAADGYEAADWGKWFDAVRVLVEYPIPGHKPKQDTSTTEVNAACDALAQATTRLIQRSAAHFMRLGSNRRLLSLVYHVAPTSVARDAALTEGDIDETVVSRWIDVLLVRRSVLGGISVAEYWVAEVLNMEQTHRKIAAARARLSKRKAGLFSAEVESADALDRAFKRKKKDALMKGERGTTLQPSPTVEDGPDLKITPLELNRRQPNDEPSVEGGDGAAYLLARAEVLTHSAGDLAAALRLEAVRRRKDQLKTLIGNPALGVLVKALLPPILAPPAHDLLRDGTKAAELVDRAVHCWRDVARGAGFPDDGTYLASFYRGIGMAPDRTFNERVKAYQQPVANVVDAFVDLIRAAVSRDFALWCTLLDWLSRDYLGLWKAGTELNPDPALGALEEIRGPRLTHDVQDDAKLLIRAINAQINRKRLLRSKTRGKVLQPLIADSVTNPKVNALCDLPPLYRPYFRAFMRRYELDLRTRSLTRNAPHGANQHDDDSSEDPPPVYRPTISRPQKPKQMLAKRPFLTSRFHRSMSL